MEKEKKIVLECSHEHQKFFWRADLFNIINFAYFYYVFDYSKQGIWIGINYELQNCAHGGILFFAKVTNRSQIIPFFTSAFWYSRM